MSTAEVGHFDVDAERALLALLGVPKRRHYSRWRHQQGTIASDGVNRARGRALARLRGAHPDEFEVYFIQEQWKIANGEAQ